jgi:hypothetical protein
LDAEVDERPVTRRLLVEVGETTQSDALEDLLRVCAPDQRDRLAHLLMLDHFEMAVEGRPREIARLEAACVAAGARAEVSDRYSPKSWRLITDWSGWTRTKMLAALGLGGLGLALSAPLVTAASAVVLLVLARRAVHLVDPVVSVSSAALEASLRPIDPGLFAKLRATRQRLTKPAVVALLVDCAAAFAELAWLLRSDGAALGNRSLQRLDLRLRQLVERSCGLAQAADESDAAPPRDPSPDIGLDALSLLVTIRDRLVGLRPTLSESRTEERKRLAVASALDAIADVDATIDRTLHGAT